MVLHLSSPSLIELASFCISDDESVTERALSMLAIVKGRIHKDHLLEQLYLLNKHRLLPFSSQVDSTALQELDLLCL